jgi:membrane protein required for beta-lactamase induction
MVKNLIDKDPDVDTNEGIAAVDAEIKFQENVTERWKADMGSDVKLAKMIRPVTLIALMSMFMITMMIDSMDNVAFNVKDSYVSLLEILMLTAFGAYFAGRTIEKAKR